jgi:hypothetical protein
MACKSWRPRTDRPSGGWLSLKERERTSPVSHDFQVQGGTGALAVPRGAVRVRARISEDRRIAAPVLLARPGYGGTIAAIRDLAQDQIPVTVLTASLLDCGRWSNYVSATIPTRPQADPKALLASLEKLIQDGTGPVAPVLLPSCDTSAWTYAAYANKLSPHFCLYAPPLETMDRISSHHLTGDVNPALGQAVDDGRFAMSAFVFCLRPAFAGPGLLEFSRTAPAVELDVKPQTNNNG